MLFPEEYCNQALLSNKLQAHNLVYWSTIVYAFICAAEINPLSTVLSEMKHYQVKAHSLSTGYCNNGVCFHLIWPKLFDIDTVSRAFTNLVAKVRKDILVPTHYTHTQTNTHTHTHKHTHTCTHITHTCTHITHTHAHTHMHACMHTHT